mmetsp:Transcript_31427/g.78885  ORF Transcript_31427/g.78885 Transcript_31427/m.78885 type:complete len:533 (-) Transcript_31427:397-1995(-)
MQVVGETKEGQCADHPLGRVVLPELDRVAVVLRELMMEVMVTFTKSNQSSNKVITWGTCIIVGVIAKHVSQGVHTEGSVVYKVEANDTRPEKATSVITPEIPSNHRRNHQTPENGHGQVELVLEGHHAIIVQVIDVGTAKLLVILAQQHPAHVRVEEATTSVVRILVSIGVAMMYTMITRPPTNRSLDSTSTAKHKKETNGPSRIISAMCPQTMVASCDTKTGEGIVSKCPDERRTAQWNTAECIEATAVCEDEQRHVQPVDATVPGRDELAVLGVTLRCGTDIGATLAVGDRVSGLEETPAKVQLRHVRLPARLEDGIVSQTQIVARDVGGEIVWDLEVDVVTEQLEEARVAVVGELGEALLAQVLLDGEGLDAGEVGLKVGLGGEERVAHSGKGLTEGVLPKVEADPGHQPHVHQHQGTPGVHNERKERRHRQIAEEYTKTGRSLLFLGEMRQIIVVHHQCSKIRWPHDRVEQTPERLALLSTKSATTSRSTSMLFVVMEFPGFDWVENRDQAHGSDQVVEHTTREERTM